VPVVGVVVLGVVVVVLGVVVVVVPDPLVGVVVVDVGAVVLEGGELVHSDTPKARRPSNKTATAMPMFRQDLLRGQLGILKAQAQLQRSEIDARRRDGTAGNAPTMGSHGG